MCVVCVCGVYVCVYVVWVLGTKLESYAKAANALDH
jgi:hypothetical protein